MADNGPGTVVRIHGRHIGDRVYRGAITFFAICVPLLVALVAWEIAVAGWPTFRHFGFSFLTSSDWDPVKQRFGAAPAIYGTLVSSAIALVIATPLAVGVSVFLSEFAPRIILGLGRALGETMAVTMLIGNRQEISASLLAPGYTMASLIANEFSEASSDAHLSALMAVGFTLLVITIIVNAIARWLVWRVGGGAASKPL
jgi:ABC-type phosphate transport system permease subunit